ncbi:MAG TPA: aminoacyl-tRNA hydrolase [Thermoanaerobaculia bacterium]|nr:aminoacyl-tRNA hydrolase [Thermoanaerobaculia bacterium]
MKQVIVVDESLALPRGKLAAQAAHAAIAAFLRAPAHARNAWLAEGMPKVVLACGSEAELAGIHDRAAAARLPAELIRDAGRTVLPEGTATCIGIGPADDAAVDAITGELKLVR